MKALKATIALVMAMSLLMSAAPAAPVRATHQQDNDGFILRVGGSNWEWNHFIPVCPPFDYTAWNLSLKIHARVNEAMEVWNSIGGEVHYYRTNTSCDQMWNNETPHIRIDWDSNLGWDAGGYAETRHGKADKGSAIAQEWSSGNQYSNPEKGDGYCPTEVVFDPQCNLYSVIAIEEIYLPIHDWTSVGAGPDEIDALSLLIHELGHPLGFADVTMTDLNGNLVWPCEDNVFPASYNAIMCGGMYYYEHRWTPRTHDIDTYNSKY